MILADIDTETSNYFCLMVAGSVCLAGLVAVITIAVRYLRTGEHPFND